MEPPRSELFPEKEDLDTDGSRLWREATWLSQLTFSYLDPLVRLAYNQPLHQADLGSADPLVDAQALNERFQIEWENECERVERLPKDERTVSRRSSENIEVLLR